MVLEVKNIKKSFKKLETELSVLRGIDLEVNKGDYLSIVGSSGAGKSTLLQIMATLSKPDFGNITYYFEKPIDPFELNDSDLSRLRNNNIGFVFQFHHLLPEFSAYENVIVPAIISGKKEKDFKKRALDIIDFVGVTDRMKHKPNELSGGEQQRFAIARSLINSPDIVFADEPTGNLDEQNTELVLDLISNIQKELDLTFITATHSDEVANRANRKLRISQGIFEKLT